MFYFALLCRGWISNNIEEEKSWNNAYYLNIGKWYRIMSSYYFNSGFHADILHVGSHGEIGYTLDADVGGVQFSFIL